MNEQFFFELFYYIELNRFLPIFRYPFLAHPLRFLPLSLMLQLSKSRQHLASSILGEIQAGILSRAITVTFDHRMTGEWLTLRHQSMNFSLSARYNLQSVPATSLSVR